jgi:hypothetical protein
MPARPWPVCLGHCRLAAWLLPRTPRLPDMLRVPDPPPSSVVWRCTTRAPPPSSAISSSTPMPKCSSVGLSRYLGRRPALSRTPPPLVDHLALLSPHQCSSILAPCNTPPWPPPFRSLSCSRVQPSFTNTAPTLSPSSTAATFSTAPDTGGCGAELQPSHHCRA